MKIDVWRTEFDAVDTQGEITLDGSHECYSLELPNVDGKPGSCIPQGIYDVELQPSPKFLASADDWVQQFAHRMPHIMGIPLRSLIMFHWGNTVHDINGCIAVGRVQGRDFISQSRAAFSQFFFKILPSVEAHDCKVEIHGGATVSVAESPSS